MRRSLILGCVLAWLLASSAAAQDIRVSPPAATVPAGSDGQLQINSSGAFGALSGCTANGSTGITCTGTLRGAALSVGGAATPYILGASASAVNFNSANTDTSIAITLPTGATRYRINQVLISGASASITTATFGVFTAAAGGGAAVVSAATAITVNTASDATNNNAQSVTPNNQNTETYTAATLFFRVGTAQGSAATANVTISYIPLP